MKRNLESNIVRKNKGTCFKLAQSLKQNRTRKLQSLKTWIRIIKTEQVLALIVCAFMLAAVFTPSVAFADNPSLFIQQYTAYTSGLTAQQLVNFTRVFQIHYAASSTIMESIHALDASYIGLVYRCLRKVSNGSPEYAIFKANNWFLKDQYGAYATNLGWGGTLVDVGNTSYQDWIAQWLLNETVRYNYNGIFLDDGFAAYPGEIWYDASNPPINPRTGTFWTAQEIRDTYVSMLNRIRAKLGTSRLIVCNGIYDGNTWQQRVDGYKYVLDRVNINGLMGEGWWRHDPETTWFAEDYWKGSVDGLIQLESYFIKNSPPRMFIPVCVTDFGGTTVLPTGATKTQVARYGFASTLLGIQSNRNYLGLTNNAALLADYYKTLYSKDVGYPLGNYSLVPGTHVYQRLFSKALVLVNPTATSYPVTLNGTYTTLNGANVSGTYNMPAYTGEILVYRGGSTPPPTNWYNSSWRYRTTITINHSKVGSSQANLPVLIEFTNPTLASKTQTNGQDFLFTDANNQKLDHQIESYNRTTGHLTAWVKVPTLSSTIDTTIRMYYGNPTCADQQNKTGVWDSSYLMVQHMSDGSTQCNDSTVNGNNGNTAGNVNTAPGMIGNSLNFSGGYVQLPRVCSTQTRFTFSAWVYAQSGARYFVSEWANSQGAFLQVAGDSQVQLYVNGVMVAKPVTLNEWHYVVGTYDGTTASLWIDGGTPSSVSAAGLTWPPSQNMYIGDRSDHQRQFVGLIDEVRVSSLARSNDWINTEYNNQKNPAAFLTLGQEETQTPSPPHDDWWNSSWQYRMNITIDHTKVSSDQNNFPILVDLTNPTLTAKTQISGQDFVFTDITNQKLDHQIDSYNSSTGHLTAWVKVPTLSSTIDTTIRMYYGNPTCADQQNKTGVWDSSYLTVLHLNEKQSTAFDSTINKNNGTLYGNVTQTAGKIGEANNFTGGYITLPRILTTQTQFTFSAWVYTKPGARYFVSEWTNDQGAFLQVSGDVEIQFYINGIKTSKPVSLNQWHYVVGTYDGTVARLWLDGGSPANASTSSPIWPSQTMYVGDRSDHQRQFNGLIDEVRVSNVARSNDWIKTEYANQNGPSGFYTFASEENLPA